MSETQSAETGSVEASDESWDSVIEYWNGMGEHGTHDGDDGTPVVDFPAQLADGVSVSDSEGGDYRHVDGKGRIVEAYDDGKSPDGYDTISFYSSRDAVPDDNPVNVSYETYGTLRLIDELDRLYLAREYERFSEVRRILRDRTSIMLYGTDGDPDY